MQKKMFSLLTGLALCSAPLFSQEAQEMGVVNFGSCFTDSKYGKKEQESFDTLRTRLSSDIESTEGELKEIAAKLADSEYVDSLSPAAEKEINDKKLTMQEDLSRYQGQFYQMMNYAQYQMMQKMNALVNSAAEKIAQEKNLKCVMNRDVCFYFENNLDITDQVIAKMDETFDLEETKEALEFDSPPQESSEAASS